MATPTKTGTPKATTTPRKPTVKTPKALQVPTTPTEEPKPTVKTEPKAKESTPKRPAKAEPRDFSKGEVVNAYHPRLHKEMGKAVVQEEFRHQHQTYVRVVFEGSEDVVVTHRMNVYPA